MIFILFFASADPDCEKPMRLRGMMPALEAIAPINARIWFGSVGSGTADHFSLQVFTDDTAISGTAEKHCYIHEGPLDNHCNLVFTPDETLIPNTTYHIRATATEEHLNPSMFVDSFFSTTSDISTIDTQPSTLLFQGYQARNITNPNSCKWKDSYQHNFLVEFPSPTSFDSMLQVYEEFDTEIVLVHTLFIPIGAQEADFRQVVIPGEEGKHCYFVQHEDIAGNKADPSNTVCFDPFAPDEPAEEPTEDPDTAIEEEIIDEPAGESMAEQTKEDTTGCQHFSIQNTWWGLILIGLFQRFRKKILITS